MPYTEQPNGISKPVGTSNLTKTNQDMGYINTLNEGLSPEVSNKAKIIFKSMINDRRDQLFKRYGAEAEKVAYGKAIAQAKREFESPLEEINSDSYIQTRNQNPLIRDIANRIMERLKYSTK